MSATTEVGRAPVIRVVKTEEGPLREKFAIAYACPRPGVLWIAAPEDGWQIREYESTAPQEVLTHDSEYDWLADPQPFWRYVPESELILASGLGLRFRVRDRGSVLREDPDPCFEEQF